MIDSNVALAKTVSKLTKQVRKLNGVVARLIGYQREDSTKETSEKTTEQEQESRQKRRHEEPPVIPDPPLATNLPAMSTAPESGIPFSYPSFFTNIDYCFFSPMAQPDPYDQDFYFMDLLYDK